MSLDIGSITGIEVSVVPCRRRSFALFFAGGEDETVAREHVGECRPWPQQFRETKAQCGLAAAAIVSVPKDKEEYLRTFNTSGATITSYDVIAAPGNLFQTQVISDAS